MNYLQDSEDLISISNKMIFQSEEINLTQLVRPNQRFRMIFFIQHFVFKTFSSTNGVRSAQRALCDSRNLDFICYKFSKAHFKQHILDKQTTSICKTHTYLYRCHKLITSFLKTPLTYIWTHPMSLEIQLKSNLDRNFTCLMLPRQHITEI